MVLTIKHYETIAGIVKNHIPVGINHPARIRIEHIAQELADLFASNFNMFQSDDERFRRDKFLAECGI